MLVVELDGSQHADSAYDKRRDAAMRTAGYRVLRLWNNEVLANLEGALSTIARRPTSLSPRAERVRVRAAAVAHEAVRHCRQPLTPTLSPPAGRGSHERFSFPGTTRTLPGLASQMATAESTLQAMAMTNARR